MLSTYLTALGLHSCLQLCSLPRMRLIKIPEAKDAGQAICGKNLTTVPISFPLYLNKEAHFHPNYRLSGIISSQTPFIFHHRKPNSISISVSNHQARCADLRTEISAKSTVWEFAISFPSEWLPEMGCQGGHADLGTKGTYYLCLSW